MKTDKMTIIDDYRYWLDGKCYWCGIFVSGKNKHIDHFLPRTLGGNDGKDNLVKSCVSCNMSKNNRIWLKMPNGNILKPKKKAKRYYKVIEEDKYYLTVLTFISIIPKKTKGGNRHYSFPKDLNLSEYGKEVFYEEEEK